jgi:hypothetical protein
LREFAKFILTRIGGVVVVKFKSPGRESEEWKHLLAATRAMLGMPAEMAS